MTRHERSPAAARQAARRLVLYAGVLDDPAGRAFLRLMELLDPSQAGTTASERVWEAYAELFRPMAADVEVGSEDQAGEAWQNLLVERGMAEETPSSVKAAA